MSKRKLIFCWNYLEWGGAQIYFLAIMKLARQDWDVRVVLPRNSYPDILAYLDEIGVPYEFVDAQTDSAPAPTLRRKLERQWRRIRAQIVTYRYLRRFDLRESILHIESPPWQDWIFLSLLSMRRANVFVTMHNFLPKSSAWREAIWKARLQIVSRLPGFHIFASNHDTKNKLKGWVEDAFQERIPVTYTCVNPPQIDAVLARPFDRSATRRSLGVGDGDVLVLCVGQFVDRKGRWTLLDAAAKVAALRGDIKFVWVTPKLPNETDSARVESYDLGERFRLVLSASIGSTREEVLSFFRVADIFALPSFVEGLPIAILEAMALGVPTISTNVYAIPEAVKHRETGLLVEAGDSDALAASILELADDAELRSRLAARGREFVMKNFDEREASRIAIAEYESCFVNDRK